MMNYTPNRGHLKKSIIRGFSVFLHSILVILGNNDKSEVQEMSKIIFNEIQMELEETQRFFTSVFF